MLMSFREFSDLDASSLEQFVAQRIEEGHAVSNPKCNGRVLTKGYLIRCFHIKTFSWSIV